MSMKKYMNIWLIIFAIIGYEYYALNFAPSYSFMTHLQKKGVFAEDTEISAAPGRAISLWLGWIGLTLMIIMNVYSMRRRMKSMQHMGRLSDWMNFHIFCGLLGPTLILFHCNFKVRGLVAISFWSMVISFASGIIGRYFYVQMLKDKTLFEQDAEVREQQLTKILVNAKLEVSEDDKNRYKKLALNFAGVPNGIDEIPDPFSAFYHSIVGDIRLYFNQPVRAKSWPKTTEHVLAAYALSKRKALFLTSYQRLMGYWRTFHFPFAIFMYVVAAIHVAAALILGV